MSKVLSICVPSYNMENYLNRCIDSMIVPDVLDKLEIIIVNDGSTDGTFDIANKYKDNYPQSIVVIDKPNGHYGSCVNASLKVATGKYFRIVDADDWVDSEALVEFVRTLETINVDCVCTNYTTHNFKKNNVTTDNLEMPSNETLDLNVYTIPKKCLHMHALSYSLGHLRRINYTQTEGICYTDTEYVYYPLILAQTIYFMDLSLYQYFIGRNDQSVSMASLKKNLKHFLVLSEKLIASTDTLLKTNSNYDLVRNAILRLYGCFLCEVYLLNHSYDKDLDQRIRYVIQTIRQIAPQAYCEIEKLNARRIPYVKLWMDSKPFAYFCLPLMRLFSKIKSR